MTTDLYAKYTININLEVRKNHLEIDPQIQTNHTESYNGLGVDVSPSPCQRRGSPDAVCWESFTAVNLSPSPRMGTAKYRSMGSKVSEVRITPQNISKEGEEPQALGTKPTTMVFKHLLTAMILRVLTSTRDAILTNSRFISWDFRSYKTYIQIKLVAFCHSSGRFSLSTGEQKPMLESITS